MLVSSTSMKAAVATTMAISQGLYLGFQFGFGGSSAKTHSGLLSF
jgi:hypothetical protein